jgi:hypothetical protein
MLIIIFLQRLNRLNVCKIINLTQELNGLVAQSATNHLVPPKPIKVQRSQEWTYIIFHRGLCLTLHDRRWAHLARARSRRRAFGGGRTLDLGATGTRAGRALSLGLITLGAIQKNRLGLGNGRLENIVAQIRNRGHLTLWNVVAHIRTGGAGGNRRFQNISRQVWFSARGAGGPWHGTTAGHGLLTRTALRQATRLKPLARSF